MSVAPTTSVSVTPPLTYRLRIARNRQDLEAVQRLRYEVFNLEMSEGLPDAHISGLDADRFDPVCTHLMVEAGNQVVATYRLQTARTADLHHGFYSEQEFDFSPFTPHRNHILELGRACVAKEFRNMVVLSMLWRGIANYARESGVRFLIGCSSLTSQNPDEGLALYARLAETALAPPDWQTVPLPDLVCHPSGQTVSAPPVPRLLGAYLTIGAKICGPPALDREFRTIDFLTFLDIDSIPERVRRKYLS